MDKRDALIEELLGDVGKVHDSINMMPDKLSPLINQLDASISTLAKGSAAYRQSVDDYIINARDKAAEDIAAKLIKAINKFEDNRANRSQELAIYVLLSALTTSGFYILVYLFFFR
jgi:hypothetical protein